MTAEGDSYQGRVALLFIKIISQCMKMRVSVLINGLSPSVFDVGLNCAFSPRKRDDLKQPAHAQKASFETKESNYRYQLDSERNVSHFRTASNFFLRGVFVCVSVCAPVFTGVHLLVFVSTLLFCLAVHSNYTLYYLVSPASKLIWKLDLKQQ